MAPRTSYDVAHTRPLPARPVLSCPTTRSDARNVIAASVRFISKQHAASSTGRGVPGPGSYNPARTYKGTGDKIGDAPVFSMHGVEARDMHKQGPGPGTYEIAGATGHSGHTPVKAMRPSYSFSKSPQRTALLSSESPGPTYSPKMADGNMGEGPAFPFGAKLKSGAAGDVPGPGAYNGKSAFKTQVTSGNRTASNFTFGAATRHTEGKRFISKAHASTGNPYAVSETPAPIAYSPKRDQRGSKGLGDAPSFSIHGEAGKEVRGRNTSPGPGTYASKSSMQEQPQSRKVSSPNHSFGKQDRFGKSVFISKEHQSENLCRGSQGPAAYNPKFKGKTLGEDAPQYTFGGP